MLRESSMQTPYDIILGRREWMGRLVKTDGNRRDQCIVVNAEKGVIPDSTKANAIKQTATSLRLCGCGGSSIQLRSS